MILHSHGILLLAVECVVLLLAVPCGKVFSGLPLRVVYVMYQHSVVYDSLASVVMFDDVVDVRLCPIDIMITHLTDAHGRANTITCRSRSLKALFGSMGVRQSPRNSTIRLE